MTSNRSLRTAAERFQPGITIRQVDRRLRVIRITDTLLRWTALPGLGAVALLLFLRTVEIGAVLDIRTAGTAAVLALGYGILRSLRRRLLNEAEDLERARSPISPGEPAHESPREI